MASVDQQESATMIAGPSTPTVVDTCTPVETRSSSVVHESLNDNGGMTSTSPPPPIYVPAPTFSSDQACTTDHSMLLRPIRLKDSTIRTIVDCVRNGTPEIRDLLVSECELIFECRVCRSLHRSLANFLAHKRVFCKEHFCESMPLFEHADDETIVVQPESPIASTAPTTAAETPSSNLSPNEDRDDVDDNSGVVAQILVSPQRIYRPLAIKLEQKTSTAVESTGSATPLASSAIADVDQSGKSRRPVKDFFDGIVKQLKVRSARRAETATIELANIEGNPNAMFQSTASTMMTLTPFVTDDQPTTSHVDDVDLDAVMPVLNKQEATEGRNSVETVNTDISLDVCDAVARAADLNPASVPDSPQSSSSSIPLLPPSFFLPPPVLKPRPVQLSLVKQEEMKSSASISKLTSILTSTLTKNKSAADSGSVRRLTSIASTSTSSTTMSQDKIVSVPCIKCRTLFTSVKTLVAHLKSVHSKTRVYFMCIFCKSRFTNSWAVGRHIMRKHNRSKEQVIKLKERIKQKAFKNVLDDKSTSDESDVEETSAVQKPGSTKPNFKAMPKLRPVRSDVERSSTLRVRDVDSKTRTLRNKRALHRCSSCRKTFVQLSSLAVHEKLCGGSSSGRPAKPKRTSNGASRENRRKSVKRKRIALENEASVKKSTRGRRVPAIRSLRSAPTVTLEQIRSLQCTKCGLSFSNLSNCRRHVAKHIGFNRYKCRYCDYMSYHRYNVCYHMQGSHPREVANKTLLAIKNSLINIGPQPPPEKSPRSCFSTSSSSTPENNAAASKAAPSAQAKASSSTLKTKKRTPAARDTTKKPSSNKRVRANSSSDVIKQPPSVKRKTATKTTMNVQVETSSPLGMDGTSSHPPPPPPPVKNVATRPETKFNISTRRNPRVFDTTPYRRVDVSTTTTTTTTTVERRSGRYVPRNTNLLKTRGQGSKDQQNITQAGAHQMQLNGTKKAGQVEAPPKMEEHDKMTTMIKLETN